MGTRSRQIPTVVQTRARALPAAVGLIALLLVGPRPVDAHVNWLWFGEVGFPQRPGHGAVDRLAIFVAVPLVVSSTALMLGYRTRPVFVPAAPPNDLMAPYRTRVMRRKRLFGGSAASRSRCRRAQSTRPRFSWTCSTTIHLFTEKGTNTDSVLYRAGPTGYRLAQVNPASAE